MLLTNRPAGLLDPFTWMNEFMTSPEVFLGGLTESARTPAVHVEDFEDRVVLHLDIPGIAPDAVKVETRDDRITVSAERELEVPEGYQARRRERTGLRFSRSWRLDPEVDRDGIEAKFSHGVLTLTLPKQEPTSRAIPVSIES